MPQFIAQKDLTCTNCYLEIPKGAEILTTEDDVFCSEECFLEFKNRDDVFLDK